jgi:hypothetical protein
MRTIAIVHLIAFFASADEFAFALPTSGPAPPDTAAAIPWLTRTNNPCCPADPAQICRLAIRGLGIRDTLRHSLLGSCFAMLHRR